MQIHCVHIFKLTEEMTIVGNEICLEFSKSFSQVFCRFFEKDIEVSRVIAAFQF